MPRKTADYPDWVMKHKKKGTYINKVGDKYYLYAAHSVRDKNTGKIRRVSDGYIGRITKEDGLIPSKSRIKTAPVAMEIGLSRTIISVSENILMSMHRSFPKHGNYVFSRAVLLYIYGSYSDELYEQSYLSLFFAGSDPPGQVTKTQLSEIERCSLMIADVMRKTYGDDLDALVKLFTNIRLIRIEENYYLSGMTSEILKLSEKYSITWEDSLWQK